MQTIKIITIDAQGRVVADESTTKKITLPIVGDILADRIIMRPDWPPLGDPDFAAKLRAWHAQHNGQNHD